MLSPSGSTPRALVSSIAFFLLICFCIRTLYQQYHQPSDNLSPQDPEAAQSAIKNSTLGFQKIFVLSLPWRTDRRESMQRNIKDGPLLDYTWRDGVVGDNIAAEDVPPAWISSDENTPGALGCFKGHLAILEEIVREEIETAVIFEDDITWDVGPRLPDALQKMSAALPLLDTYRENDISAGRPYGVGWSILWLGTCHNPEAGDEAAIFKMPWTGRRTFVWDAHEAIACTYAYAVTRESARRIIGFMRGIKQPYDLELSAFCKHAKCPMIWPSLFRAKKLGSNIEASRNVTEVEEVVVEVDAAEDGTLVELV